MDHVATVLYVEDNSDNRLLVRRVLQAEGYQVLEAGSAQQALETVLTNPPDLILMDINLPGVDGYTLTAQVKSIPSLSRIPIIALTANVMKGDRERFIEAGFDEYLAKPVDIDELLATVARHCVGRPG